MESKRQRVHEPRELAEVLIIGAGPAGLAVAGCLRERDVPFVVLEKSAAVGASWRRHYERLRLHTVKEHSALPGLPFPDSFPRYPSRAQMVEYLEAYAQHHRVEPQFGVEVTEVRRGGGRWVATTGSGRTFASDAVVIATGANRAPVRPCIDGETEFRGTIAHSAAYRSGSEFAGRRVLVVGMGNTGAEIALDLAEHGARPSISVRSPTNIVYRDVAGRPTQLTALMLSRLPDPLAYALARVFRDLTVGDLSRYGIRTPAISPLQQLREQGKTPVIDVGTVARIRAGDILVRPGLARLTRNGAVFADGTEDACDAVILATGYDPALEDLLPTESLVVDDNGMPTQLIGRDAMQGICFVGFDIRQPGGLLRAIAHQARAVAEHLAARSADAAPAARAA